jgi:hypothetical protein
VKKVWATLRTLGILLALWVILAAVGLIAGVIPLDGGAARTAEVPDAGTGAQADAGVIEADAGVEGDAGTTTADATTTTTADPSAAARWSVCAATVDPSLAAAQLFGDERPEIVIGCGDRWEVIAIGPSGPARIATFTAPAVPTEQRARTGPAATGDVDGDGNIDLVLPLAQETEAGASRGGGLFWIARDGFGGIREPVALAPIAAWSVSVSPLDAQDGADIVAMNRANALAQLPSEAWVFGGGSAPARRATVPAGLAGIDVLVSDLDRDGYADVVSLARDRVGLGFGDGRGAFARTHSFTFTGAREIALGDVDGDGGVDLAVLGDDLRWIPAGPVGSMEPRGVDGVPATLRGLSSGDPDGDGKLDFIGWDHPRLVILRQQAELTFTLDATLTLVGDALGPRRHALVDVDADGSQDDLVLLGTALVGSDGEAGPIELVIVPDAIGRGELTPAAEAAPLPDAPLMLRATLPAG